MSAHNHREFVEGCFRCDLHREEVRGYEESTPDTQEVREMFTDETMNPEIEGKRFDRWHAEELRKARAEALREAAKAVESAATSACVEPDSACHKADKIILESRADQIERGE